MRLIRLALGALAGLGLVLPLSLPAAAAPAPGTSLPGAPSPAVAVPGAPAPAEDTAEGTTDEDDDPTRDPEERADVLRDETATGSLGHTWLSRSLEEIALALRARAGLPTTDPMPQSATGELVTVPTEEDPQDPGLEVRTVRVQVEDGLPVDHEAFAEFVMEILTDERGWGHDGSVEFVQTDAETAEISVVLASPELTDRLCVPLATAGKYSCGREGRAVLNAVRWSEGAQAFLDGGGNITEYRQYLVNHEVGHLLGNPHVGCPAEGEPAPIMVQQTISLDGCAPNPWPATTR